MNNFEETYRKYLKLRRKGDVKYLKKLKKKCEKEFAWTTQKIQFSPEKLRYLVWTDIRGDNAK